MVKEARKTIVISIKATISVKVDLQNLVKPYFLIHPDFCGCLGYFSFDNCSYGCDDDILELEGYDVTPFHIPGIEEWCLEWDEENYKAIHGEPSDFDWDEWHKRGLDLAQQLRQLVPDDIEIVYRKGTEDIILDKFKDFFLSPDTSFVVGDTNLYSICYDEDVLEIGYFPPIPLEGLDEWWRDFDSHVDYADTWADPDYDWMTWYCRGLEMAKKIRDAFPESVEVWYKIPYELKNLLPIPDLFVKADGSFLIKDFLSRKES